jgi:hypothetical protein
MGHEATFEVSSTPLAEEPAAMNDDFSSLPPDIVAAVNGFLRERDGELEVADLEGLRTFVFSNMESYPALTSLLMPDKEAIMQHFERTGMVPPGVKIARRTPIEGSNVTKLEVFRGPTSEKRRP